MVPRRQFAKSRSLKCSLNEAKCGFFRARWPICIAPRRENLISKTPRCGSHSLTFQHTSPALPVVRQGALRLDEQLQHQLMKLTTH